MNYQRYKNLFIFCYRYGMSEGKVTRHIDFPNKLDLQPYMSSGPSSKPSNPGESLHDGGDDDDGKEKKEEARVEESKPCSYNLYAVLVHDGYSTNSGHYYCYIKTKQDVWYCMNDHMVRIHFILFIYVTLTVFSINS